MNQPKGEVLFYCAGSLIDHVTRDCPRLRERIAERGKGADPEGVEGVRQRYVTTRSYIPRCPTCAPPPPRPRRPGRWHGRGWLHGGRVVIWTDPATVAPVTAPQGPQVARKRPSWMHRRAGES